MESESLPPSQARPSSIMASRSATAASYMAAPSCSIFAAYLRNRDQIATCSAQTDHPWYQHSITNAHIINDQAIMLRLCSVPACHYVAKRSWYLHTLRSLTALATDEPKILPAYTVQTTRTNLAGLQTSGPFYAMSSR